MEQQPYLIIMPGALAGTEKVIGSGENPEKLAESMEALGALHPGKTLSLRGPEGELLHTVTVYPAKD